MSEVEILHFGSTTVALMAIERDKPARQAERAAAQAVASLLLGREVRIEHHDDGAPFIADYGGSVSISHSRSTVAVAIDAERSIGIDIEDCERAARMPSIAPRVLTASEIDAYSGTEELLRAWTLKEAAYKAARAGVDFLHDIQLPCDGNHRVTAVGIALEIVASGVHGGQMLSLVAKCG